MYDILTSKLHSIYQANVWDIHLKLKSVFILDHKLEIFILPITIQSCRKLFYGEGVRGGDQSKSVSHHGWQNRNDLKSHICNFFWKYYMGHTTFIHSSKSSSGHQSFFFFNFRFSDRKSQSQQKLAKKVTYFTIQFHSKNLTRFTNLNSLNIENNMLSQHRQKTFWL